MKENLELDIQTQRVRRLKMPELPQQTSEMLREDTSLSTVHREVLDASQATSEMAVPNTTPVPKVGTSNGNKPLPTPNKSVVATPTWVPASQPDSTSSVKASKKQKALLLSSEHAATKGQIVQERLPRLCLCL